VLGGRVDNSTVHLAVVFLKLDIVEEGGGLVAIIFVAGLGNHYTHCQGIDNLQASPPAETHTDNTTLSARLDTDSLRLPKSGNPLVPPFQQRTIPHLLIDESGLLGIGQRAASLNMFPEEAFRSDTLRVCLLVKFKGSLEKITLDVPWPRFTMYWFPSQSQASSEDVESIPRNGYGSIPRRGRSYS
jgi:hypothetical protein